MRVFGLVVLLAAVLSGCSEPTTPARTRPAPPGESTPLSGPASARAVCGVRQVYWHGHWWVSGHPGRVAGASPQHPIIDNVSGTMIQEAQKRARFVSPALVGPVELFASPEQQVESPPLGTCVTSAVSPEQP